MDSKGLGECNSLEQDKACWCGCCRDGRKRLVITVSGLTVLPLTLAELHVFVLRSFNLI